MLTSTHPCRYAISYSILLVLMACVCLTTISMLVVRAVYMPQTMLGGIACGALTYLQIMLLNGNISWFARK